MAFNRCGLPTPPDDSGVDQDHRKCPVCGWSPCLKSCALALDAWTVDVGLAELQDMDQIIYGCDPIGEEPFLPPEDYVDEGDFQ